MEKTDGTRGQELLGDSYGGPLSSLESERRQNEDQRAIERGKRKKEEEERGGRKEEGIKKVSFIHSFIRKVEDVESSHTETLKMILKLREEQ